MECFIKDLFSLLELDKDELIYETNCGHIFSVQGMDNFFKEKRNIQIFLCPLCQKPLFWEPRYQNYIRTLLIDIQKVKEIALERYFKQNGETFYSKSRKIVKRILEQFGEEEKDHKKKKERYLFHRNKSPKIDIFESYPIDIEYGTDNLEKKIPVIYNLCKNEFFKKNNINIKKCTTYNLLTLAEKFMGIEYFAYDIQIKNKEEEESMFLSNFNIIKKYFATFDGRLTYHFFKDLKKKIDNMLYYSLLKLRKDKYDKYFIFLEENYDESEEEKCENIKRNKFSSDIDLKKIFQKDFEDFTLIQSLGTTWYKCPNGHPYFITECGRPMEESVCPECNSKIGGLNHNLVPNNTEIDIVNNNLNSHHNENNILLNQDEEAYNNMNINDQHQMDPEVEEAIRNHPEMNEYN